jgi:hypothetical protein
MSLVAVAEPAGTLAEAIDELVVLVRNEAGGSCVWCGSRDLWVTTSPDLDHARQRLVTVCPKCGAELVSDRPSALRHRWL